MRAKANTIALTYLPPPQAILTCDMTRPSDQPIRGIYWLCGLYGWRHFLCRSMMSQWCIAQVVRMLVALDGTPQHGQVLGLPHCCHAGLLWSPWSHPTYDADCCQWPLGRSLTSTVGKFLTPVSNEHSREVPHPGTLPLTLGLSHSAVQETLRSWHRLETQPAPALSFLPVKLPLQNGPPGCASTPPVNIE